MRCGLINIFMLFLFINVVPVEAGSSSGNIEILKEIGQYIESFSDDRSLVTFASKMSFMMGEPYRSVVHEWKKGDQVYLTYHFENNQVLLQHAHLSTSVWGGLKDFPSSRYSIASIKRDTDGYHEIILNTGVVFKSSENDNTCSWDINDRVFFLFNPSGLYQVWNIDKKTIMFCKLENLNHIQNKPFEIKDVLNLEDRINAKVLQQPEATRALLLSLLNYTAGLKEHEKPIGVFLFIGPTGVGKNRAC